MQQENLPRDLLYLLNTEYDMIDAIITHPSTLKFCKTHNPQLMKYFSKNCWSLIEKSLLSKDDYLGTCSFNIINETKNNLDFTKAIKNNIFKRIGKEILVIKDDFTFNQLKVSRYAQTFQMLFDVLFEEMKKCVSFLVNFVPFASCYAVQSLFEYILASDSKFVLLQKQKIFIDILGEALNRIASLPQTYKTCNEYFDPCSDYIVGLYQIVSLYAKNPVLLKLINQQAVDILMKISKNTPRAVKNAQTATIAQIAGTGKVNHLVPYVNKLLEMLALENGRVYPYHESVILALSSIASKSDEAFGKMAGALGKVFVNFLKKFPNNSIIKNAILKFISTNMQNTKYSHIIIFDIFSATAYTLEEGVDVSERSFLLMLGYKLRQAASISYEDKLMMDLAALRAPGIVKKAKRFQKSLEASYGGDIPVVKCPVKDTKSDVILSSLTPEQLALYQNYSE